MGVSISLIIPCVKITSFMSRDLKRMLQTLNEVSQKYNPYLDFRQIYIKNFIVRDSERFF